MMSYLLFLILFWKPIYNLGRYIYSKFYTKDDTHNYWGEQIKNWFVQLVALLKP